MSWLSKETKVHFLLEAVSFIRVEKEGKKNGREKMWNDGRKWRNIQKGNRQFNIMNAETYYDSFFVLTCIFIFCFTVDSNEIDQHIFPNFYTQFCLMYFIYSFTYIVKLYILSNFFRWSLYGVWKFLASHCLRLA